MFSIIITALDIVIRALDEKYHQDPGLYSYVVDCPAPPTLLLYLYFLTVWWQTAKLQIWKTGQGNLLDLTATLSPIWFFWQAPMRPLVNLVVTCQNCLWFFTFKQRTLYYSFKMSFTMNTGGQPNFVLEVGWWNWLGHGPSASELFSYGT